MNMIETLDTPYTFKCRALPSKSKEIKVMFIRRGLKPKRLGWGTAANQMPSEDACLGRVNDASICTRKEKGEKTRRVKPGESR